jgi:hypothetical protein
MPCPRITCIASATFYNASGSYPVSSARVDDEVELQVRVENVGDATSGPIQQSFTILGLVFRFEPFPCNQRPCVYPALAPGGSQVLRARFRVHQDALPAGNTTAVINGTVTVRSGMTPPGNETILANNSIAVSLTVLDRRRPDLRIASATFYNASGSYPVSSARVDDDVELRVLVENVGNARSGPIQQSFTIPGLAFRFEPLPCNQTPCVYPSLAPGGSQVLRARFRVHQSALPAGNTSAVINGTATVRSGFTPPGNEIVFENNSIAVSLTVLDRRRPDLRIASATFYNASGSYPVSWARVGDDVELRVLVENVGNARSGPIQQSFTIPGLAFRFEPLPCNQTPCVYPSLAPGGSQVLRARFRVDQSALPAGNTTAVISGAATVRSGFTPPGNEIVFENNSIAVSLTVFDRRRPDVRLVSAGFYSTLSAGATPLTTARVGDEVELRVLVENVYTMRSGTLNLSVDIPGLERLGQSPPCPGGVTSCSWPSLGVGQSQSLGVRFRVTELALGGQTTAVVAGPATVRSSSIYVDGNWIGETNLSDNAAQLTLTVLRGLNVFP